MKNNDNFLADFFALIEIALKEKAENPQAEKDTTEKQCKCTGNHCKNQQDFNEKLLGEICKCKEMIDDTRNTIGMELYEVYCNIKYIEEKLRDEIEKACTDKPCV